MLLDVRFDLVSKNFRTEETGMSLERISNTISQNVPKTVLHPQKSGQRYTNGSAV